ncbi:PARP-domain-containing protein [Ascodesmis nigricans]|uniref:Poly [ADP-ribose] polymerase n=1 Tax=Ascodesmis nigricans TaxID=341454 RepID=A0A4S2N1I2_9PEZI|nr:PARP-domain-containing protein [Ascodesmis nigricans]
MKTVLVKKGKAPVDDMSGMSGSAHVYVDSDGVVFDACLNQTQIASNNNKFYYIQLLQDDLAPTCFTTFTHWGRVGERGQCKFVVSMVSLSVAEAAFRKQFKAKTGVAWENRDNAHGGSNKYAYLARNYDDDEDEEDSKPTSTADTVKIPDPTIERPLQELMKLIFNTSYMQQVMASLSYDANKLPLGKLSKETIMRGYTVLKEIGDVISQPHSSSKVRQLQELSSRYYTVIPHDFGRQTPPAINSIVALKKETDLVENLSDMKITAEIMASTKETHDVNPIDKQFQSLGLNEAVPLEHSSKEFQLLESYLHKTHGNTHYMTLKVEEIFRVTRSVEDERWEAAGFDSETLVNNRKLLWHGSRATNFSGILSQGLRIAPPEAPVTGYMFDKGIYLADIATKSANYCVASISNNTGLLLLCEAQLGDPMLELTNADYYAGQKCKDAKRLATKGLGKTVPLQWEDAGIVHDKLRGVMMPKVSGKEKNITGDSGVKGAYLQYNEYIVYDVAQVKIRYLFRCKFS